MPVSPQRVASSLVRNTKSRDADPFPALGLHQTIDIASKSGLQGVRKGGALVTRELKVVPREQPGCYPVMVALSGCTSGS